MRKPSIATKCASSTRETEVLSFADTWVEMQVIMLNEISRHSEASTVGSLSHTEAFKSQSEPRIVITRDWGGMVLGGGAKESPTGRSNRFQGLTAQRGDYTLMHSNVLHAVERARKGHGSANYLIDQFTPHMCVKI